MMMMMITMIGVLTLILNSTKNNTFSYRPSRQDILGQFSMVNLELFNIVEDIKKVSKAFVVHPKNVNADNATSIHILPLYYIFPFIPFSFLHYIKFYLLLLVSLHTVLPVMLSSKLLPEMELDDNLKREQLLRGMQSLQLASQIEKLKVIITYYQLAFHSIFFSL